MPQSIRVYQPMYVNTDADATKLAPVESPYLKNYRTDSHRNADNANASGYGMNIGSNMKVGAPCLSNIEIQTKITLPAGFNKIIGSPEFEALNECYFLNYNENGQHGIYMIDGNTMEAKIVAVDPVLNFSLDPRFAIPEHRCSLVVVYRDNEEGQRDVLEKFLIFTDGNNWQRWVNVNAAIRTNGFDVSRFSYWNVRAPHFDRAQLFDYASRPPMHCPPVSRIPYNPATDFGKVNKLLNKSYQFAYRYVYTDGRKTTLSPYSNPITTTFSVCNPADLNVTRCLKILLDGGGPMVEYIELYQRESPISEWVLYDTIAKYKQCGLNDPDIIGTDYWLRSEPWADYNYDPVTNLLTYKWCGDRAVTKVDQNEITQIQTGLPIKSIAQANLGDSILFADNLYGYDNWSCELTDAFTFTTEKGTDSGGCNTELVNITLYAYIGGDNRPHWRNQCVWSDGPWKNDGTQDTFFGGFSNKYVNKFPHGYTRTEWNPDDAKHFGLSFNKREGPIMYLAGTDYYAVGKQWKISASSTDPNDRGIYVGPMNGQDTPTMNGLVKETSDGAIFYFRFDFTVPKNRYVARLARHDVDLTTDYKKTSTYVAGLMDSRVRNNYGAGGDHYADNYIDFDSAHTIITPEMVIDAFQDIDVWRTDNRRKRDNKKQGDMFCIFAPYDFHEEDFFGEAHIWRFNEGYMYEDVQFKIPVELMQYWATAGHDEEKVQGTYTDHNGFYWSYVAKGHAQAAQVGVQGQMNCQPNSGVNIFNTDDGHDYSTPWKDGNLHRVGTTYITGTSGLIYQPWSRVRIEGFVKNCATGAGIGNVSVTLTRGASSITGANGKFVIYAHPDTWGYRVDELIFNGSLCDFADCDCQPLATFTYSDQNIKCEVNKDRMLAVPDRNVKVQDSIVAMLKHGGRYGIGAKGYDLAGRETFIQQLQYIDIPSVQENGGLTPVVIRWKIPANLKFPKETKYISFYRTENLNFKRYVQWVGDKMEFIDALGNPQPLGAGATRARVTIQSLLDFNVRENFATTVNYQVQKGDIVRFIDDGDGHYLMPEANSGFLDYIITGSNYIQSAETLLTNQGNEAQNPDPKWFYINYDSRLDQLKDKCMFWIEIRRDADTITTDKYFEICGMIPVVDQVLYNGQTSGTFETWDTYTQRRQIINTTCPGKRVVHGYESSSITDFWGEDYPSNGRINVQDKTAIQLWYGDDCIRSNLFVNEGKINGLGTFFSTNRKQFKGQKTGAVVAVHAETKVIVFVCDNDWFMTSYDMNYVRNTPQGIVANNLNNQIDDNFQKVGDNNGCRLEDTSGIIFRDKFGWWPDANNRCIVKFNYQGIVRISEAYNRGYFESKFTYMLRYNAGLRDENYLNNCMEVLAGYDPGPGEYTFTFRKRNFTKQMRNDFVNVEREVRINGSETFVFSVAYDRWVRWMSFIPESYGRLRKARDGKLLLTFCEGKIFAHNSYLVKSFNNFYGIQDTTVAEVVVTDAENKQLHYQSVFIDCTDVQWHVDRIVTNERNSYSYIPPSYFKKKEHVLYAEVLRDMSTFTTAEDNANGRVMLLDGKRMFGNFAQIRFLVNDENANTYFEVERFKVKTIDSHPTPTKQ